MGKRGPAPNGEYVGQTAVLSTRITPDLRARLEDATQGSGKTLSREIEHRLRRTFIEDDKISEAFGSRKQYALMRMISIVLSSWHNPADLSADWTEDATSYDLAVKKIVQLLKAMRPDGPSTPLTELEQAIADGMETSGPAQVIASVQSADEALPLSGSRKRKVASMIRSDLGPMIERPNIFFGTAEQLRTEAERLQNAEKAPVKSTRKATKGARK